MSRGRFSEDTLAGEALLGGRHLHGGALCCAQALIKVVDVPMKLGHP